MSKPQSSKRMGIRIDRCLGKGCTEDIKVATQLYRQKSISSSATRTELSSSISGSRLKPIRISSNNSQGVELMTGFMSLSEVDRRAKDLGMSYGQYVAQYRSDEVIRTRPEPGYGFGLRPGRRRLLSVGRTREGMQKYADTIVEMYGNGYSLKDIALEIGVTEFELARFLSKAGLTREECMGRVLQKNAVHTGGISYEAPCYLCENRRCDDRKMCKAYKRWAAKKWNEVVAPFRALKAQRG